MKSSELQRAETAELDALVGLPPPPPSGERMYAITFDLDQDALKSAYPGPSHTNAYFEIRKILIDEGFNWTQGSVYFGGDRINAVTCVLAAQRLARELSWFAASVRDIRMLRIEDNNDLGPAVGAPNLTL
jgi:virulence-associated protein VapD